MIPPIGSIGAPLSLSQAGGATAGESSVGLGETAGLTEPASGAGQQSGGLSGLESANGLESIGGIESGDAATGAGNSGFGDALTNAISSLEQTQQSASSAAQGLATGTISDPEAAVVTVEEAQLAMQLAGQIRTKATEAAQQIFQTQV